MSKTNALRSLLLGGVLPVIIFTVIENRFGTLWGLIAGMILGLGEILTEKLKQGRVEMMTWAGNGMLLLLGGVSLFTQEGVWFKLQPAVIEAVMAVFLVGAILAKKPLLWNLAQKQGSFGQMPEKIEPFLKQAFQGLTLRMGLFFGFHAGLATWAALKWSTAAWAFLKGVGFTGSMILYLGVEALLLRRRISLFIQR